MNNRTLFLLTLSLASSIAQASPKASILYARQEAEIVAREVANDNKTLLPVRVVFSTKRATPARTGVFIKLTSGEFGRRFFITEGEIRPYNFPNWDKMPSKSCMKNKSNNNQSNDNQEQNSSNNRADAAEALLLLRTQQSNNNNNNNNNNRAM